MSNMAHGIKRVTFSMNYSSPQNLHFRQNAKTIFSVLSSWINKMLNKNKIQLLLGQKQCLTAHSFLWTDRLGLVMAGHYVLVYITIVWW